MMAAPLMSGEDFGRQQDQARADLAAQIDKATIDWDALADKGDPPPREFAWRPRIPRRRTTLFHGFGGVGKTLLAQQIGTAYSFGIELFGGATEAKRAMFVAGEDDHDEVWRRSVDICRRLSISLRDLAGKFHVIAVPHLDITLAEADQSGAVVVTKTLDVLRERIERFKPGLVILDNSAKLFAIKEGDRIGITRAVGHLDAICHDFDTTCLLIAHDNKAGDISGSTAWENACRSRLHLVRNDEDGSLELQMPKANYAAVGSNLTLRWDNWSFRAEDPALMTPGERLEADMKARANAQAFLDRLDKLTAQGRTVSHSPQAQNYAPKVMANRSGAGRREIEAAMALLFEEGRIKANMPVGRRANRTPILGIGRVDGEGS
jgi:RecA-family ATPase